MSAAARKKIALAQKKRWATKKAAVKKATPAKKAAPAPSHERSNSQAAIRLGEGKVGTEEASTDGVVNNRANKPGRQMLPFVIGGQ
jgi:hypothetical protein